MEVKESAMKFIKFLKEREERDITLMRKQHDYEN